MFDEREGNGMKKLLTSAFLLILASGSSLAQDSGRSAGKVEYSVDDSIFHASALRATENGKTYQLIDKSKGMCLQVIDQRDFDGNGFVDALVEHVVACGGNCCADTFFFVSAFGGGRFELSDEFADSWGSPVIEKWKGRWSVVVTSNNEGVNTQRPVEITRRFILESGKAVQVDERTRKDLESIVEIRSEMFDPGKVDETHSIEYDLDGDGKKDQIKATLWWRWGRMFWVVDFADGKKFSSHIACKRIGVLKTKTNGVSDLVCDQDTVFRWNGREYQATATE
jgi:hypothetical protein